jgi:hypothetical protein
MEFNQPVRAYAYNLTFKDIFKVYLQNQNYDYDIESLTNRLFILRFRVHDDIKTITDGRLRVVCLFPTAVLTDSHSAASGSKADSNTVLGGSYLKYLNNNYS